MGVVSLGASVYPYMFVSFHTLPVHLYVLLIPYVPHMSWDLGASIHAICHGVFWGASVHLSGISVSVSTYIFPLVHNSHTSCFPSLWVASLLDWMPMDACYASCCCLVMVVYSSTSPLLSVVTMAPYLMGLPATSGQYDLVLSS